jgi:hypothetical protein
VSERRRRAGSVLAAALLLLAPAAVQAGPPYLTDDPEPVGLHHGEAYLASTAVFGADGFNGPVPLLEANYGAATDLQLHLVLPFVLSAGGGGASQYGLGDLELGAKYRFVDEEQAGIQVGVFPIVTIPTGASSKGLGEGSATLFLPVWLQKSIGPWTSYGGGGYRIRPGPDGWFLGWLVQRRVGPVAIGAEVFHQTDSERALAGASGFTVGLVADLGEHHHLLASFGGGPGSQVLHAYLGWQVTFGPED